ncbi:MULTISPECIES: alpha-ribazole phosphatase [Aminobacterium]|mgnify:CR=1 FL=1|uniref:alpha-ribazole phosphatase n=1 Tax=Aminobacterium TaxID=81466 RepID=UPI000465B632|nr:MULTISPECIES: alpha-ribazole phosphatase [Aminobacterium]
MALKQILFVRHGRTDWNNEQRYQGHSDVPLNEEGLDQARRVSLRLASFQAELIVSSPLQRAAQTAAIIAEHQVSTSILLRKGLEEIGFGEWEGLTVTEVEACFPEEHRRWRQDPSSTVPGGGESFSSVQQRVDNVLKEIMTREEERILVVAHGGTIRTALVSLLGVSSSLVWRMRLDNCSISCIQAYRGLSMLSFLNDATHLYVESELVRDLPILL